MFVGLVFLSAVAAALAGPASLYSPPQDVVVEISKEWARPKISVEMSPEFVKNVMEQIQHAEPRELIAILNEFADKIFENLGQIFIHNGMDPFAMPEIHTGFNYTFIITYHGELDLTGGWLQDISTIHRAGDVVATYDPNGTKQLLVEVPIGFNALAFTYDYSATIMDLGPKGGVEGKITDLKVKVSIGFDFAQYHASLEEFFITDSGHIDLNFSGNPLVDWLLNLLIDVATIALKEVILLIMEVIVRDPIQAIIDVINEIFDNLFHTTTAAPAPVQSFVFYVK